MFPEYNTKGPISRNLVFVVFHQQMSEANMVEQKWLECLHFEFIQQSKRGYKGTDQQHSCCIRRLCFLIRNIGFLMFLQHGIGKSNKTVLDSLTCILTERHNAVLYICKHISHKYVQAGINHCKKYDIKYHFCLTGNKFFRQ